MRAFQNASNPLSCPSPPHCMVRDAPTSSPGRGRTCTRMPVSCGRSGSVWPRRLPDEEVGIPRPEPGQPRHRGRRGARLAPPDGRHRHRRGVEDQAAHPPGAPVARLDGDIRLAVARGQARLSALEDIGRGRVFVPVQPEPKPRPALPIRAAQRRGHDAHPAATAQGRLEQEGHGVVRSPEDRHDAVSRRGQEGERCAKAFVAVAQRAVPRQRLVERQARVRLQHEERHAGNGQAGNRWEREMGQGS